ncbi:unnamed protein product [Adineta ricciae]|uniref:Glycosyltransferase family 2 protein n=1 Tax=Adineta ricciae TaxID=249248 RepID=A0A814P237_ADIRI|nr:unnamed protein product [Adineta ricciae]CAF1543126.1 unnamed protein product [Adineta ricciae]
MPSTTKLLRYCRHISRRLFMKTFRLYPVYRILVIIVLLLLFLSLFILFFYAIFIYHLNYCCFNPSDIIVSLTTTPKRFHYELPIAVHSLLTQTILPKEIRIYLSPKANVINRTNLTLEYLKIYVRNIDRSRVIGKLFDQLVQLRMEEEDYGPATKYLPIIKEFHSLSTNTLQSQRIIICDDDHYYHPYTISTLMKYSDQYKNSIIGLRGWRIREDLSWGVGSAEEFFYHIVESARLSDIYRVGIVTANHGYLIRPSFFDSHIYLDFNQAPADIRRVDDIWLNGYASKRNISRFVVPTCCRSISVTRTHELENYLIEHHMTRSSANDHALKWFNQTWERDLWYRFYGQNRPQYSSGWRTAFREWLNVIIRLRILIYYGFV